MTERTRSGSDGAADPSRDEGTGDPPADGGTDDSSADGRTDSSRGDGSGGARAHTVRLELEDAPGELLRALSPIADAGGNLLSIHHERGTVTPSGRIPVEIDLECPADRFDDVVDGLREAGVSVVRAGPERYDDELAVILSGDVVETDLSGTLSRIESAAGAAVVDLSLSAPDGTDAVSSARIRLAVDADGVADALRAIRDLGDEKGLVVVEPLVGGGG